jgi:hypothetical protein
MRLVNAAFRLLAASVENNLGVIGIRLLETLPAGSGII